MIPLALAAFSATAAAKPLKVFISVDMEGVSGVVSDDQASSTGKDYERFRRRSW
jgi:D-amino peptidase